MDIAGHRTEKMHRHYAPSDAEEKQEAARKAFGGLKVIDGGEAATESEPVTQRERRQSAKPLTVKNRHVTRP